MAKGLAVYAHNGEDYIINDQNTANEFSTSTAYAVGAYCYYNGTLYRFTSAHSAGAWNSGHVTAVLVTDELKSISVNLAQAQSDIDAFKSTENSSGGRIAEGSGIFPLDKSNFDIGTATGDSGGFVYQDDNTRVRTKPGYLIHLDEGYTVSLSDFTAARFFFHRRNPDGTYTHSNGWYTAPYQTTTKGDYVFTIEAIPAVTETSVDKLFNMFSITYKGSKTDNLMQNVENASGKVLISKDNVEIGSIGVSSSGWTYADSNKRIRSKEGTVLHMYAGDSFGLTDYSAARFYYGYKKMNGDYVAGSWMTHGFTADVECDFVFVAEKVPEAVLGSVDELYDLIYFQREKTYTKVSYDFGSLGVRSINHQGYNPVAPNNTMPAFKLSKVMGFDFVETDVRFSSDNVPVLCHDATIDNYSDGTGTISQMTYEQLLQYDFGSWKSAEYTGTKIGTLEDLLALCGQINLYPYCEVMSGLTKAQAKICIDLAKEYHMLRSVTWISMSEEALRLIVNEDPGARVMIVVGGGDSVNFVRRALSLQTGYNEVGVDLNYTLSDSYREAALRFDMPIEMWTVDTVANIQALPDYVKGVTSNTYPVNRIRAAENLTLMKPSIFSSRISGIDGGYSVRDNKVMISMTYTGAYAADNTPQIASGFPETKRAQAVSILKMDSATSIGEYIPGFISTDGKLYAEKVASGASYVLTGEYSLI